MSIKSKQRELVAIRTHHKVCVCVVAFSPKKFSNKYLDV